MNDKELIRQIQSGRKELLNDVIERYYKDILHFCIYQIHNTADAYDLTQETFYRFIRCVDTYAYRNLKAYLVRIARNLCMDYWHHKTVTVDADEQMMDAQSAADGGSAGFEQIENEMILAELLAGIPAEQREVIVMRYYCGLKIRDIAKILDIHLSTVKSRQRLGIMALKKAADSAGAGEERKL